MFNLLKVYTPEYNALIPTEGAAQTLLCRMGRGREKVLGFDIDLVLFIYLFYLLTYFLPLLVSTQWTLGPVVEMWQLIAVKLLTAFEVSFI